MNILSELNKHVLKTFKDLGYNTDYATVTISNRPDLCQFTCNAAMPLAKVFKKNPLEIAKTIAESLKENPIFQSVDVVNPGFVNINVTNLYLESLINKASNLKNLVDTTNNDTIIIDYGGPNVAKPMHVGHLRSAIIGESIKRIGAFLGFNMVSDIHLGDWGLQLGLVITEIKERYPELEYFKANYTQVEQVENEKSPITADELNQIYPYASAKSKEDETYYKKALEATKKLQNLDPGYFALWKHIINISVQDMKKNYKRLDVNFDLWNGEQSASKYVDELIDKLNQNNLLYESDGALVVDVKEDEDKLDIPPVLIKKSDGSMLYATTDLATIIEREENYKPSQILYVVDKRQNLHFTQVFRCAKKAKLVNQNTDLRFIGFGTINDKQGKPFKTREGGVMRLETLIDLMSNEGYKKVNESSKDNNLSEEEKIIIGEKVGLAALKFGDLYNTVTRDYNFDIDRFITFEGKTGPYLLFNLARINSILAKLDNINDNAKIKLYDKTEVDLILKILQSEDVILKAFNDASPNYICEFAYDIASLFSKFYETNIILKEPDKNIKDSRVTLIILTKNILEDLLYLLGIETVERM